MTFIEFKKLLLDADISLPKFSKLIKVSEKNLQAYKKKEEVPNAIAVIVKCFAHMKEQGIDYKELVESLELKAKTKEGAGFSKGKKKKEDDTQGNQSVTK
jgi:DNA-binding protein H-NS